jgi:hypothetical protein
MRMDIENSPGAQAGVSWPAARDSLGQRLSGDDEMFGNCLCCILLRDPCRERRGTMLVWEHGEGVLWHHAASTLIAAIRVERLRRPGDRDDSSG